MTHFLNSSAGVDVDVESKHAVAVAIGQRIRIEMIERGARERCKETEPPVAPQNGVQVQELFEVVTYDDEMHALGHVDVIRAHRIGDVPRVLRDGDLSRQARTVDVQHRLQIARNTRNRYARVLRREDRAYKERGR